MTLPTTKQALALEAMLLGPAMPARLGEAMWRGDPEAVARRPHGATAQGFGRSGGTMGTRLVALGWAYRAPYVNGWPQGYAITREGREAFAAWAGQAR